MAENLRAYLKLPECRPGARSLQLDMMPMIADLKLCAVEVEARLYKRFFPCEKGNFSLTLHRLIEQKTPFVKGLQEIATVRLKPTGPVFSPIFTCPRQPLRLCKLLFPSTKRKGTLRAAATSSEFKAQGRRHTKALCL